MAEITSRHSSGQYSTHGLGRLTVIPRVPSQDHKISNILLKYKARPTLRTRTGDLCGRRGCGVVRNWWWRDRTESPSSTHHSPVPVPVLSPGTISSTSNSPGPFDIRKCRAFIIIIMYYLMVLDKLLVFVAFCPAISSPCHCFVMHSYLVEEINLTMKYWLHSQDGTGLSSDDLLYSVWKFILRLSPTWIYDY